MRPNTLPVCLHDGEPWTIVGLAVQSDHTQPSPEDCLKDLTRDTVDATVASWSGRWLLLGDGQIWTDASAMLRCYYCRYEGWTYAALRPLALPGPKVVEDAEALRSGWVVPPRSGYQDVNVLLPSQRLDLRTGQLFPRQVFGHMRALEDDQERLDHMADRLQEILAQLRMRPNPLYLGLSSGKDSRLILAAEAAYARKLKTYTFARKRGEITRGDMELPPRLAKLAGVSHELIRPQTFDGRKAQAFEGANPYYQRSPSSFYTYYANGYLDGFTPGSILLNGLCGEFGRGYYHHKMPAHPAIDEMANVLYANTRSNRMGLKDLRHWMASHPMVMDIRERFYWEGRLAGWASVASEQIAAVSDLTYLSPLNCADLMQRTLELSEELRYSGDYIRELVFRLRPVLNSLPYNPPDPLWRRSYQRAKRFIAAHAG